MASLLAEAQQGTIGVPRECAPIVMECLQVIDAADNAIKQKQFELDLAKQLQFASEKRNQQLEKELANANLWYKRPEVVAPLSFFIGVTVNALANSRK